VPKNWTDFLKESQNKEELFLVLAMQIISVSYKGDVVVTSGEKVLRSSSTPSPSSSLDGLAPCTQEEADSRIFLHASHGVSQGYRNILIRSVDTDVVALAVHYSAVLDCNV
jgi:hypothetical protein